jgi:hypothetical protein
MNGYKRTVMTIDNVTIDDHIKVSGVLYRITAIEKIGTAYLIQFQNVRRPILNGMLTLETNTLMHIWNQK